MAGRNEFDGVRCNEIDRRKYQDVGRRGTDQPVTESHDAELARLRGENAKLRREIELRHCPDCGDPYDLLACSARHFRIQQADLGRKAKP